MGIVSDDTRVCRSTPGTLVLRLLWAVTGLHTWQACVKTTNPRQLGMSTDGHVTCPELLLCTFVTNCMPIYRQESGLISKSENELLCTRNPLAFPCIVGQ